MALERREGGWRVSGARWRPESGEPEDSPEPLLSILVAVRQDRSALAEILDNLLPYCDASVEVVVIDGGSTDGSAELLRARGESLAYWLSEPDRGLYEAMNKAIGAARGRYLLHINAGDRVLRLPLGALRRSAADVISARVEEEGNGIFRPRAGWPMRFSNTWHHQGTFYRRTAHPGYDVRYRVYGDFELNQRMVRAGTRVELLEEVVAFHGRGGLSDLESWYFEQTQSLRENFGWRQMLATKCWYAVRNPSRLLLKRARRAREVGVGGVLASLGRAWSRSS